MLDLEAIFGELDVRGLTPPRVAAGPSARAPSPPPLVATAPPGEVCPDCRRPVDAGRRCWRCHRRPCSRCHRNTGSAFIELCILCDFADGPGGASRGA